MKRITLGVVDSAIDNTRPIEADRPARIQQKRAVNDLWFAQIANNTRAGFVDGTAKQKAPDSPVKRRVTNLVFLLFKGSHSLPSFPSFASVP